MPQYFKLSVVYVYLFYIFYICISLILALSGFVIFIR